MSRVLYVQGDHDVTDVTCALLATDRHDIETADDAAAALERLSRPPLPDVVIIDLVVPDPAGWRILTTLRDDPRFAALPVLVVSVLPAPGPAPADAYLPKPYTRDQLRRAVAAAVERRAHRTP